MPLLLLVAVAAGGAAVNSLKPSLALAVQPQPALSLRLLSGGTQAALAPSIAINPVQPPEGPSARGWEASCCGMVSDAAGHAPHAEICRSLNFVQASWQLNMSQRHKTFHMAHWALKSLLITLDSTPPPPPTPPSLPCSVWSTRDLPCFILCCYRHRSQHSLQQATSAALLLSSPPHPHPSPSHPYTSPVHVRSWHRQSVPCHRPGGVSEWSGSDQRSRVLHRLGLHLRDASCHCQPDWQLDST